MLSVCTFFLGREMIAFPDVILKDTKKASNHRSEKQYPQRGPCCGGLPQGNFLDHAMSWTWKRRHNKNSE